MSDQNSHSETFIVGLRFQKVGKVYHFDAGKFRDLEAGDFVVVETSRGTQLGEVIHIVETLSKTNVESLKPILRKATPQDLVLRQIWQQKENDAIRICRDKVKELGLVDVKIISAEYSFDGSKLYFLYSSEAGDKTDLRSLRRSMQRTFQPSRIEMHLIGPRDVAKVLGGMGACGLENRCCSAFLVDFNPISIKMAKEQGISLTPAEITGMCGRLRCCLVYEYEQYFNVRKKLPKRGKWVRTPMGEGKVTDVLPLKESVLVLLDKGSSYEFSKDEIETIDEVHPSSKKEESGNESIQDSKREFPKKSRRRGRGRTTN